MLRNILTPLDGSPAAEHALPWSFGLARQTGAAVHLVRTRDLPPAPTSGDGLIPTDPSVLEAMAKEEDEYMARIAAAWRDDESQLDVKSIALDLRDATADMLRDYARDHAVDLTVMTTHGRGGLSRALFGSVTDRYLRIAPGPTLLLRTDTDQPPAAKSRPRLDKVVVPLDGSRFSEQAIAPAVRLFEWFGCEIELLMVIDALEDIYAFVSRVDGSPLSQKQPGAVKPIVEEYLRGKAEQLKPVSGSVSWRAVEHGEASEAILAGASLPTVAVAMATHGRSGLSRTVFGSVADRVIRGAKGPVLIVRPTD